MFKGIREYGSVHKGILNHEPLDKSISVFVYLENKLSKHSWDSIPKSGEINGSPLFSEWIWF